MFKNYTFLIWLSYKRSGKAKYLKLLDELMQSQWLEEDAIRQLQLEKIREIISYARKNCEYYRQLFAKIGLTDERDIKDLNDIRKIPVLTKAQIRQNLNSLTAGRDDQVKNQTGGSTGIPLHFYCNSDLVYEAEAGAQRGYAMGGHRRGEGMGIIWGYDKDLEDLGAIRRFLKLKLYKINELNSFNLSEERIGKFLDWLKKSKIQFVKGYANSLAEVSRYILKNNIKFVHRIKAVFSEAEKLEDENRQLIEKAFGTEVFNLYGCREFGRIAAECEIHNGLHINFEQVFVEVDEENRVLVTSFLNRETVFIRYENGDCADKIRTEKCLCGRSSPRLGRIIGRTSDNFLAPDGRVIHGEYVTHLFYSTQHVEQFQVIQKSLYDFDIRVVSDERALCEKELSRIKEEMSRQFNAKLNVKVHFVDSIAKTDSGKRKFTICEVSRT